MIYCCACHKDVSARATTGAEIYPRHKHLHAMHFWVCDACGNYVGCHNKDPKNRTRPLGCIPTQAMRKARSRLHALIDPIWQSGKLKRGEVYQRLAWALDRPNFHTAETRSLEDLEEAYDAAGAVFAVQLEELDLA